MADKKITDLPEIPEVADDDYLEIVDTSANTSNKISRENLIAGHDHDSDYLGITAKAADSDKLDGKDSTEFLLTPTISNTEPTPTASSGTFTTASAACKTMTVGKLRIYIGFCYINSKGTASGTLRIPIPTGTPAYIGGGIYAGTANINSTISATCRLDPSNSYIEIDKYDGTSIINDYTGIAFTIVYAIE